MLHVTRGYSVAQLEAIIRNYDNPGFFVNPSWLFEFDLPEYQNQLKQDGYSWLADSNHWFSLQTPIFGLIRDGLVGIYVMDYYGGATANITSNSYVNTYEMVSSKNFTVNLKGNGSLVDCATGSAWYGAIPNTTTKAQIYGNNNQLSLHQFQSSVTLYSGATNNTISDGANSGTFNISSGATHNTINNSGLSGTFNVGTGATQTTINDSGGGVVNVAGVSDLKIVGSRETVKLTDQYAAATITGSQTSLSLFQPQISYDKFNTPATYITGVHNTVTWSMEAYYGYSFNVFINGLRYSAYLDSYTTDASSSCSLSVSENWQCNGETGVGPVIYISTTTSAALTSDASITNSISTSGTLLTQALSIFPQSSAPSSLTSIGASIQGQIHAALGVMP